MNQKKLAVTFFTLLFLVPIFASAATQCPNLTRNLSFGSRGNDVVQLQDFLIAQGDLAGGNNTGYFGNLTRTAVRKFQCREMSICSGSENTNGYGSVGPKTRAKIASVCAGKIAMNLDACKLPLEPRVVSPKKSLQELRAVVASNQVTLKFTEGTGIRLRDGILINMSAPDITAFVTILNTYGIPMSAVTRAYSRSEADLDAERAKAQCMSGRALADANLYYKISLLQGTSAADFSYNLNALDIVEFAEPSPVPSALPTLPPQASYSCTPLSAQTQMLSCPAGQTGSITQTRTSTCPGPIWNAWQTTANTCTSTFQNALQDLRLHFWTGDFVTGYITPTWDGIVGHTLPDSRGAMWNASTYFDVLFMQYQLDLLGSAAPLTAQWNFIKTRFTDSELTACGGSSPQNFASDDTGWNAAMYLQIYDATRDARALNLAKASVQCAYARWGSQDFGGGLWYNDTKNTKSLYETGIANDAFRIYQLTNDASFLDLAQKSYDWMEKVLRRSDNIYWAEYGWWPNESHSTVAPHPLGVERPNDIKLAGSVSFLAGNMGMDLLHARMYRLTGDDAYKQRAINTARSIFSMYADFNGGFLDDRDAWTNGHFAREWIIEVYPLLPADVQQKARDMFDRTAQAVVTSDRTADGYYGGAWNGPLNSAWDAAGSVPQQIMTSATAVDFIAGPLLIDARLPIPYTPPPPPPITASLLGQTGEDLVGMRTEGADGIKDVHVRLTGITNTISRVRIGTPDGAWEWPMNATDWIVKVVPGTNSTSDLYFDFYKQASEYTVTVTTNDGREMTAQAR